MAASIKIEFDDGSKVMQRTLNVDDGTTPAGYVNNIDIDILQNNNNNTNAKTTIINEDKGKTRWKSDIEFNNYYENKTVAKYILQHKFQKVGFQLPDYYLIDAPKILTHVNDFMKNLIIIEGKTPQETEDKTITLKQPLLFILGDTSYGECCVDEVAASHLGADAVIHYGRSCLQQNSRLPVKYIFGKANINVTHFINQFLMEKSNRMKENVNNDDDDDMTTYIILHDVEYAYAMNEIKMKLIEYNNVYTATTSNDNSMIEATSSNTTTSNNNKTFITIQGQYIELMTESNDINIINDKTIFIYIGTQTPRLIRLIMRYNMHTFLIYDPNNNNYDKDKSSTTTTTTSFLQPAMNKVGKLVNKRYFQVQKAKDASIFGILVGTLSVARYKDVLIRVKQLLKAMGRKYYTFIVGKINVAKLANHSEVDVYVLIACPENSLLDNKEFYKPIVTPFELEVALNPKREWNGSYSTDYSDILGEKEEEDGNNKNETTTTSNDDNVKTNQTILKDGKIKVIDLPSLDTNDDDDVSLPYMSLIDGKMKSLRHTENDNETTISNSNEIVNYAEHSTVAVHTASEYMNTKRTFKGLEQRLGETKPMKAVQGLSGIAQSYQSEPSIQQQQAMVLANERIKSSNAIEVVGESLGKKKEEDNMKSIITNDKVGKEQEDEDTESDDDGNTNTIVIKPLIDSDSSSDDSSD